LDRARFAIEDITRGVVIGENARPETVEFEGKPVGFLA
jgi:hypothetical protein